MMETAMGAMTIRRLDEAVIARIKALAKANGRSMEEEARLILEQTAMRPTPQEWAARMDKVRREIFGDRVLPDSTPLIREMRYEDDWPPEEVGGP
jgi:plasmid stability protein